MTHTDPLWARPVGNRSERDNTSQENRSRVAVMKTMVTELVNGVIDSGRFVGPSSEAGETPAVGNSVCKRRCRSYHGLAANGHKMMVGESGGESPFVANPRRNAAFQMSSG